MKRKAEISTSQLAVIILAVVGFALLAVVLVSIYTTQDVNKEICHQSVITRATTGGFANIPSPVSLNCVTEKLCITAGLIGGNCKETFTNTEGVKKIKVKNIDEVNKFLSEQVVECWTVMGEGKVSLFDSFFAENYGFGLVYPTCVICSRVAFDSQVLAKKNIDLSKIDVENYMRAHKVPGKTISYYEFLSGGSGTASFSEGDWSSATEGKEGEALKKAEEALKANTDKLNEAVSGVKLVDVPLDEIPSLTQEKAILFMQITAPTYSGVWKATGITILGALEFGGRFLPKGSFISPAAGLPSNMMYNSAGKTVWKAGVRAGGKNVGGQFVSKSTLDASGVKGATLGKVVAPLIGAYALLTTAQMGSVAINQYITAGYCGDVSYGDNAREGCSVVRLVDYNITEIKKYCAVIESKNN